MHEVIVRAVSGAVRKHYRNLSPWEADDLAARWKRGGWLVTTV